MLEQRKLIQTWNEGARALGFRKAGRGRGRPPTGRARSIGLRGLRGERPHHGRRLARPPRRRRRAELALDRMSEHLAQFGEQRRASGRTLTSATDRPLQPVHLSDWEDLDLAQAARWLAHGRTDYAWAYLNRCTSDQEQRTLLAGSPVFRCPRLRVDAPLDAGTVDPPQVRGRGQPA